MHHLCSRICWTVIRLVVSKSSIRRNNDNAKLSIFDHGDIVIHELSPFHLTNSAQPVVGSSHGSSKLFFFYFDKIQNKQLLKLGFQWGIIQWKTGTKKNRLNLFSIKIQSKNVYQMREKRLSQ